MKTIVSEKVEIGERELERARKMIEKATKPLKRESRARLVTREDVTIRPEDLCPWQGHDVVRRML